MATNDNPFGGGATGGGGSMFGGGMWGGGGYGMQQPSPYGGMGGGYSPYGMPQGYGSYGGYPQQSPYGGYSPYGMPSQYGPQPSYGMPQQQTMAATQEGAGDATAGGDVVSPADDPNNPLRNLNIGGSTSQTNRFDPWGPQQEQLRRYLTGMTGRLIDDGKGGLKQEEVSGEGMATTGAMGELYKQQQAGPLGFDPQSEAALQRMQALSTGANPMVDAATGAATDITSGRVGIGTGGMFQSLYNQPGIQNLGQYQSMYDNPNIGGIDQYGRMAGQNAIGNADQYSRLYNTPGIDAADYRSMYNKDPVLTGQMNNFTNFNGVGTGNYRDILGGSQGDGSLAGGMFGEVARGDRVDSNPYREKAIQDAMSQTADEVKATMSSRGRFGSDAYGDAMGRALGQVATQARMQGYDTDTANMMAAAQARSGEGLQRQGIGLSAAQGIAGAEGANVASRMGAIQSIMNASGQNYGQRLQALQGLTGAQQAIGGQQLSAAQGLSGIQGQNYQAQLGALGQMNAAQQMQNQQRMAAAQGLTAGQGQNWQNQLGAAQGLTGINSQDIQNRMAAAGMAPAMQGLRYDDIQRQLQAGATREAMAQQQRNYGWDTLRQFQGLVGGVPGSAGTAKGTESQPWWQTALGLGATAAGMWGAGTPTV